MSLAQPGPVEPQAGGLSMRRTIGLLGAVVVVLFSVGCGPPDAEEISQQGQSLKATPLLMSMGNSCPAANTCGPELDKCSEWSAPTGCGPSTCTAVQYQTCVDSNGNQ